MTTKTQVSLTSANESTGLFTSSGDTTEIEHTIDNLLTKIRRQTSSSVQTQRISEEKRNKHRYDALLAKIKKEKNIIEQLRVENEALREEVARCETKIQSYPRMKKKYDALSDSLSKSAEAYSTSRTISPRRRPFD